MNKADCYHLGNVAKLHGFKGEVSLFFDVTDYSIYKDLKSVYIEINGNLTPFSIEKIQLAPKNFAIVKLEGINSDEDATFLLKQQLYLPLETLPVLLENEFYDHEIVGYQVADQDGNVVGEMEQVIDLPVNPLFQVKHTSGKEVLLPLRKEFIIVLNKQDKIIQLEIPEGLIELYLE